MLSFPATRGGTEVPLEFQQRRLLNVATARARAFARNQLAEQMRAEIAAERESMQQEIEALREKMQTQGESLQAQMAALHRKLAETIEESRLLREWWSAHTEHRRAKAELAALVRQNQLEEALAVTYDPAITVKH
jgi:hypothetical protein